jgi:hypothetical protein
MQNVPICFNSNSLDPHTLHRPFYKVTVKREPVYCCLVNILKALGSNLVRRTVYVYYFLGGFPKPKNTTYYTIHRLNNNLLTASVV